MNINIKQCMLYTNSTCFTYKWSYLRGPGFPNISQSVLFKQHKTINYSF